MALCLVCTIPQLVIAHDNEAIVIPLSETIIYSPCDHHNQKHPKPTNPNSFHATLDNHTVIVEIDNAAESTVTITNLDTWTVVTNRQFIYRTTEAITIPGTYMIEINNEEGSVNGYFDIAQ